MLNFLKNVFLGILSFIVPMCLIGFMAKIPGNPVLNDVTFLAIGFYIGVVVVKFFEGWKDYKFAEVFWYSVFISAGLSLVYTIGVTLYGGFEMDNFSALPFAFAPVCVSIAYCCLLGILVCGLRLKENSWNMNVVEMWLTWSIIFVSLFFAMGTIYEVANRDFAFSVSDTVTTIVFCAGCLSIVSLIGSAIAQTVRR